VPASAAGVVAPTMHVTAPGEFAGLDPQSLLMRRGVGGRPEFIFTYGATAVRGHF